MHGPPTPTPRQSANSETWAEIFGPSAAGELRVGGIAVPRHRWDIELRRDGVFRSVEYRILKLCLNGKELQSTTELTHNENIEDVVATIRPLRPLRPKFERYFTWPVSVSVGRAVLWSYKRDLFQCLSVTVLLACSFLLFGILGPQLLSVYSIPSLSMYPTLEAGDAVLVEKLSLRTQPPTRGEIVFFRPPDRLITMIHEMQEIAASSKNTDTAQTSSSSSSTSSTSSQRSDSNPHSARSLLRVHKRDLFVKRIAALPGDQVGIEDGDIVVNGKHVSKAAPGSKDSVERIVPEHFVYVLGDNAEHSLDSRYWGLLRKDDLVGRPLLRIWPPARISEVR